MKNELFYIIILILMLPSSPGRKGLNLFFPWGEGDYVPPWSKFLNV
jgi:hypothetical protein